MKLLAFILQYIPTKKWEIKQIKMGSLPIALFALFKILYSKGRVIAGVLEKLYKVN